MIATSCEHKRKDWNTFIGNFDFAKEPLLIQFAKIAIANFDSGAMFTQYFPDYQTNKRVLSMAYVLFQNVRQELSPRLIYLTHLSSEGFDCTNRYQLTSSVVSWLTDGEYNIPLLRATQCKLVT